jgi:iron complex transport system ATP-binding protein
MNKTQTNPALKVTGLSVNYEKRLALQNINFEVCPGQILGIIGPNGAGKTTLIRALSGVIPFSHGQIIVNDKDLQHLSPVERARMLAVVPQARSLPPAFTAWETVLLGRTPYLNWFGQTSAIDEDDARLAMQQTDTLDLAERRVGELSGGEQQRLLLARALAQGAPILLLDEPITHLDLQYQVHFLELVKKLAKEQNLTVVIALHDLNMVARYTDQVLLLVKGEQKAFGRTGIILKEQLLSDAFNLAIETHQLDSSKKIFLPK